MTALGNYMMLNLQRKNMEKIKRTVAFLIPAFLLFGFSSAWAAPKGTNISVDSSQLEPFGPSKNDKEGRLTFYRDENVAVDVNDDAEPNMNMQF